MAPQVKPWTYDGFTRWQTFIYCIVPLAVFWGILFCFWGHISPNPDAIHPIILGSYIALMFAGLFGAVIWASERQCPDVAKLP